MITLEQVQAAAQAAGLAYFESEPDEWGQVFGHLSVADPVSRKHSRSYVSVLEPGDAPDSKRQCHLDLIAKGEFIMTPAEREELNTWVRGVLMEADRDRLISNSQM